MGAIVAMDKQVMDPEVADGMVVKLPVSKYALYNRIDALCRSLV